MRFHFFVLSLTSVLAASAEIHYVSPGMSIQEAVDGALPGDSIVLEEGLHDATVVPYGKDVVIGSRYLLDGDTAHISATTVQPDYIRPDTLTCFVYAYGESPASRLVGLRLANGRGTVYYSFGRCGGAVFVLSDGSHQANVSIDHCRIESCRAAYGGGVYLRGWGLPTGIVLDQCSIYGCSATQLGGGAHSLSGSLITRNCVFEADTAHDADDPGQIRLGSAIFAYRSQVIIDSSEFRGCAGTEMAVHVANLSAGYITNCYFHHNLLLDGVAAAGTDLVMLDSYMSITRCHFDQNQSGSPAICLGGHDVAYSFVGNVVENGMATQETGAIGLAGNRGDIGYNVIRNYVNGTGGTINSHSDGYPNPQVRIHHCVISGNISLDPNFPSAVTTLDLRPTLDSNWFYGNTGVAVGPGPNDPGVINARHNWWGHPSGPYHPTQNPGGQGDTLLSDSVLFIPWLTEPPDTTMPDDYLTVREHPQVAATWVLMDAYPNPFNQSVTLTLAGFTGNDFEIGLYNLLGQQVDVVHRGALTGGQIIYQAPPHLASGVYLLSAKDKHGVQTKKVVLLK